MSDSESYVQQIERLQEQIKRLEAAQYIAKEQNSHLEAALTEARQQQTFYRNVLQEAREGIIVFDSTLHYLHWNPAMEEMMGLMATEVLGRHLLDVVPQAHENGVYVRLERALAGETLEDNDLRIVHPKTGEIRWRYARFSPLRCESGAVMGVVVTVRDVTEQRAAEARLRESEERFRKIFEEGPLGISLVDTNFRFKHVNPRLCAMTGYTEEELLARTFVDITHPEDSAKDVDLATRLKAGEIQRFTMEKRYIARSGETIWVDLFVSLIRDDSGAPLYYLGLVDDITERKRAEAALCEEARRQAIVITAQQEIATVGLDQEAAMRVLLAHARDITYADASAVILAQGEEMVYRAAMGTTVPYIGMCLKRGCNLARLCVLEGRMLRCDDSESDPRVDRDATRKFGVRSMVVVPLLGAKGVIGVVQLLSARPYAFTDQDMTMLQLISGVMSSAFNNAAAMSALQESEERFRSLVDDLPLIIWMTDAENERILFNRYWAEFVGATQTQHWVPRETDVDDGNILHPDDRLTVIREYGCAIQSRISHQVEFRLRRYDGEYRWILDSCRPRYAPDGTFLGYIGSGLDITDRKAMQAQITEASRMESLGRLAGGIAHDFNNMLSAVVGYAELAGMEVEEGSVVADYLGHILTSAEHATTLTGQLLTYARRQSVECHAVPLNEIVRRLEPMLQISLSQKYKLNLTLVPSLWQVWANAGQLEQVLLNLVLNARDAMPHGGPIGVETGNVVLDADYATAHLAVTPGDYVLLRVTDHGIGMPPEVKERIFDPFFTTKPVGQGTGLGLATCYAIVKQSGGTIYVDTEPGQGATFTIYLPRHNASPAPTA